MTAHCKWTGLVLYQAVSESLVGVSGFLDTGTGTGSSVGLNVGVDILSSTFDGLQGEGKVVLKSVHVPVVHTCVLISLVNSLYSL